VRDTSQSSMDWSSQPLAVAISEAMPWSRGGLGSGQPTTGCHA
jgi:hypothetical protein